MSDRHASGSNAESNPEPPSSQGPREEGSKQGEGWLDRLWAAVGLKPSSAREDLEDALEEADVDPAFSPEERLMLQNILDLRETRVEDIMVPRADMRAIDESASLAELIAEFDDSGHSRLPVYRDTLDEAVGMVHIKDLMGYFARRSAEAGADEDNPRYDFSRIDLTQRVADADLVRKVLFVPPSMAVTTLLATMQSQRTQLAVVIDEYGGTDGLVSIEDAIETVVGEIEDEYDEEEPMLVAEGGGVYIADAAASVEDVVKVVGAGLMNGDGEAIDTIGGLVFRLFGRVPVAGESIAAPGGFTLDVLDADQRRVKKVRILAPQPDSDGGEAVPEARAARA